MPIKDNTNKILAEVDRLIKVKLQTAALMVERTAKQICAVKTGTLKRSIISNWYGAAGSRSISWPKRKGVKAGRTEIPAQTKHRAIIGTNIEYAPHLEMGTSKMSARPFLRPALEANMEKIRKLFVKK